ncbi:glutathione S-transferase family protein [Sporobolomyces salmoneus]|uniref:glutathione S-transferase family protein n=1 Tax=Sporobolomyces salmoneus TaxID=183962 RepID=UPI003177AE35
MNTAARRTHSITSQLAHRSNNSNFSTMSPYPSAEALSKGPAALKEEGLVLLTSQTPNGNKPAYYLEELKATGAIKGYTVVPISFKENEQKSSWFEAVNPNGRIPALLDNRVGKKPIRVFESGSILRYLAKIYDKEYEFHFEDSDLETEMESWIEFQMGGGGPMQGQANHFFRYAPEKIPYGIERYQNETKRLYGVMEDHLTGKKDGEKKEYLVGGRYSVADMMSHGWIRMSSWAGVDIEPFPALKEWVARIEARPATQAALKVPDQDLLTRMKEDPSLEERTQKASAAWVQQSNNVLKK